MSTIEKRDRTCASGWTDCMRGLYWSVCVLYNSQLNDERESERKRETIEWTILHAVYFSPLSNSN